VPALNMMAMTMGFAVRDKGQLADLQPMQKVEFQLAYDGNDYLITEIK
jgi:Cu/Ag efflux protein CusF